MWRKHKFGSSFNFLARGCSREVVDQTESNDASWTAIGLVVSGHTSSSTCLDLLVIKSNTNLVWCIAGANSGMSSIGSSVEGSSTNPVNGSSGNGSWTSYSSNDLNKVGNTVGVDT